jgi:hypothetical protein
MRPENSAGRPSKASDILCVLNQVFKEEGMTTLLLPPPENPDEGNNDKPGTSRTKGAASSEESDANEDGASSCRRRARRNKGSQIPDVNACLDALSALPGLIAIGMISPAQANAMSRVYATLLQHHERTESVRDQRVTLEGDALELLRTNPRLASLLEPFLTDDQIDSILGKGKESPNVEI